MMKGAAYFFSCACRPGETNFQTWWRMAGMEMKMARTMATFIQVQKASVGEVNTSSVCIFASGLEMKRMAGSVTKNAMTSPTSRAQRPHDARAQLAQVLHERHLAEGALLLEIGGGLLVGHHDSVRKCSALSTTGGSLPGASDFCPSTSSSRAIGSRPVESRPSPRHGHEDVRPSSSCPMPGARPS